MERVMLLATWETQGALSSLQWEAVYQAGRIQKGSELCVGPPTYILSCQSLSTGG